MEFRLRRNDEALLHASRWLTFDQPYDVEAGPGGNLKQWKPSIETAGGDSRLL